MVKSREQSSIFFFCKGKREIIILKYTHYLLHNKHVLSSEKYSMRVLFCLGGQSSYPTTAPDSFPLLSKGKKKKHLRQGT